MKREITLEVATFSGSALFWRNRSNNCEIMSGITLGGSLLSKFTAFQGKAKSNWRHRIGNLKFAYDHFSAYSIYLVAHFLSADLVFYFFNLIYCEQLSPEPVRSFSL